MTTAYINRIATSVPPHDVHEAFVVFARTLLASNRDQALFARMVDRAEIAHRWSVLAPARDPAGAAVDAEGFYSRGRFPSTARRMARYEAAGEALVIAAVERLGLGGQANAITHVIIVSCTGMSAPGFDLAIIRRFGLRPSVERTAVGFMGCQAALNALKLARHIVRSEPGARVLIVAVELCTLHLGETDDLEKILSFLIFGDGCAAALVSADETGLAIDAFRSAIAPEASELITWSVRDQGFDMYLSGQVPAVLARALRASSGEFFAGERNSLIHWAVHPGGSSVLNAIQSALGLDADALRHSRRILRNFGNMSSPTVLFVLRAIADAALPDERGCAVAFGPGLSSESMLFRAVG